MKLKNEPVVWGEWIELRNRGDGVCYARTAVSGRLQQVVMYFDWWAWAEVQDSTPLHAARGVQ